MNPARKRAYIELLIVTAIWGLASPIIKYTLGGLDSLTFLTYRFGLSSIVAFAIFWIYKLRLPSDKKVLWKLIGQGFVTSSVALGFLFFGLKNTTVLDSSLITLASPLLITIAGVVFLNEHVTRKEKIGMAIALVGTVLTIVEPLFTNGGGALRLSGNIMIVGYLIATAWGAVLTKEVLRMGVSPLIMMNVSFIIGFLTFLPIALIVNKNALISIHSVSLPYHLGVFFMAFVSGSIAYYLGNRAQKTIEIGEAAVFSYLYPLFAAPLAVIWLGEKITPMIVVGGVIITFGVFLAEIKKKKYN